MENIIYYMRDITNIVNKKPLTIRKWWLKGKFPKPILLGGQCAWRKEIIDKWLKDKFIQQENIE